VTIPASNLPPLIVGEVLFDHFPDGKQVLGGAPFNVAWNLQGMGLSPQMVTAVGQDAAADDVVEAMNEWGMSRRFLQSVGDKPTGKVEVKVVAGEPNYDILKDRAWDYLDTPEIEDYSQFSWLYYGSLAYRSPKSAETIRSVIQQSQLPRFVDVNIRPPWFDESWLKELVSGAQWLKVNQNELESLTHVDCSTKNGILQATERFREQFQVENFCVTAGSRGALLVDQDSNGIEIAVTSPDPMVDTVGAGDGFASILFAGLIAGIPLEKAGNAASRFAGKVCQLKGATCRDPAFYQNVFD